ncbi:MAG: hypothetical protein ACR2MP_19920, partial [Streptosporangiaceae bacterium]
MTHPHVTHLAGRTSPLLSLPGLARTISAACLREDFPAATLRVQQVLCLAEETGAFVGAYRRWAGLARRTGPWDDVQAATADVLGIDLDAAWRAKAR